MDHPLRPLLAHWLAKIGLATEFKKKEFQDDADECERFFDGPYEFMYGLKSGRGGFVRATGDQDIPKTSFAMTVNKVAEAVQLFGPVLYARNPHRMVTPRKVLQFPPELFADPADPFAMQAYQQRAMAAESQRMKDAVRAEILQGYLNHTPEALGLKREARLAIDECIIKGMGLLWTETWTPPGGGHTMVGSFFDTVNNMALDSDARDIQDARWCARKCVHPVWQVERDYGLPRGSLKGHLESHHQQSAVGDDPDMKYARTQGRTADLLCYWKVYSKMGIGGRLEGLAEGKQSELDVFGDYCYLAVAAGVPFPLNVPESLVLAGDAQAVLDAVRWPTPYWADGRWPFEPFVFHERPGKLWPMSHFKPGLGELKFLNWAYSFIASKIRVACRDFIAIKKSVGEDLENAILQGTDYELLRIEEQHGKIDEVVKFLQHPEFNKDIWTVIEAISASFDKRVGMTELMYGGTSHQLRSAEEANIKAGQMSVRPDDMAAKVEESMTGTARMEALCARWHLTGSDVAAVVGEEAGMLWDQVVTPSDPSEVLFGLEYRIEAGGARKPNKEGQAAQANQAMQTMFQPLFDYAMTTGDVTPVNTVIAAWAEANDMEAANVQLKPPPPPPMPGVPGAPPPPPEGVPM
jgi:hypothetical protein